MSQAKEAGLWALGHPKEIGGQGLPFLDYVYINEVVGRSDIAIVALGTHSLQDSIMLNEFASEEWRDRYLKPLVEGDIFPSFAMTEPEVASSDVQLRAENLDVPADPNRGLELLPRTRNPKMIMWRRATAGDWTHSSCSYKFRPN